AVPAGVPPWLRARPGPERLHRARAGPARRPQGGRPLPRHAGQGGPERGLMGRVTGAVGLVVAVVAVVACSSGGSTPTDFAGRLCPTVEGWSAASVGVVNHFSDLSVNATGAAQRRQYYEDAFAGLQRQLDDFSARLDRLPAAPVDADAVKAALAGGVMQV